MDGNVVSNSSVGSTVVTGVDGAVVDVDDTECSITLSPFVTAASVADVVATAFIAAFAFVFFFFFLSLFAVASVPFGLVFDENPAR